MFFIWPKGFKRAKASGAFKALEGFYGFFKVSTDGFYKALEGLYKALEGPYMGFIRFYKGLIRF